MKAKANVIFADTSVEGYTCSALLTAVKQEPASARYVSCSGLLAFGQQELTLKICADSMAANFTPTLGDDLVTVVVERPAPCCGEWGGVNWDRSAPATRRMACDNCGQQAASALTVPDRILWSTTAPLLVREEEQQALLTDWISYLDPLTAALFLSDLTFCVEQAATVLVAEVLPLLDKNAL